MLFLCETSTEKKKDQKCVLQLFIEYYATKPKPDKARRKTKCIVKDKVFTFQPYYFYIFFLLLADRLQRQFGMFLTLGTELSISLSQFSAVNVQ